MQILDQAASLLRIEMVAFEMEGRAFPAPDGINMKSFDNQVSNKLFLFMC